MIHQRNAVIVFAYGCCYMAANNADFSSAIAGKADSAAGVFRMNQLAVFNQDAVRILRFAAVIILKITAVNGCLSRGKMCIRDRDLYKGASLILTPVGDVPEEAKKTVEQLARDLKFGRIVYTTPQELSLIHI